jgi:hypothetical protein
MELLAETPVDSLARLTLRNNRQMIEIIGLGDLSGQRCGWCPPTG